MAGLDPSPLAANLFHYTSIYCLDRTAAGLVGMRVGGRRRILVRPERGWFKGEVRACLRACVV
jgi:hypothetical protein